MVSATGWTLEYIDECMTLPRFHDLIEYWNKYPPTHILVHLALGGRNTRPPEFYIDDDAPVANPMEDFLAACAGLGIPIQRIKKSKEVRV